MGQANHIARWVPNKQVQLVTSRGISFTRTPPYYIQDGGCPLENLSGLQAGTGPIQRSKNRRNWEGRDGDLFSMGQAA